MFPHCWGGGGKGERKCTIKNVKCKTESDWITNNSHIAETKACISSPTGLDLEGGSSSKPELASMTRRDSILLQYFLSLKKKQCEQKWNHKLSSSLQIFEVTLWKPGGAKERAKTVFKTLETTAQILAPLFWLSALKSEGWSACTPQPVLGMVVRAQAAETGIWCK